MESTLTRMNRLGSSLLMGVPLLTVDEVLAAFDAVTIDDVTALARELWRPERAVPPPASGRARARSARRSMPCRPALAQAA